MPTATDLIIKNGAAMPVDKTFTLLTPAAGDNSSAQWALKEGTISAVFPTLEISTRRNSANSARKCLITLKVPSSYTIAATGLTAVGSAAVFNCTVTIPADYPEARKADFQAFVTNVVNDALVKACIRDAYPAN